MNKILRTAGILLLVWVLISALAACGQTAQQTQTQTPTETETKEIVVETPPASPTPMATPTPSVPPVAVTTVPMPMPSVSPTPGVTTTDAATTTAAPDASPVVSPSPTVSPSPATPVYSADAAFASTIRPDGAVGGESTVPGFVSGNGVIFRAGPSVSARAIATLENGTYVDIVGTEYGWTEVIINGVYGYISSDYVTRGSYVGGSTGSYGGGSNSTVVVIPDSEHHSAVVTNNDDYYFLGIKPD